MPRKARKARKAIARTLVFALAGAVAFASFKFATDGEAITKALGSNKDDKLTKSTEQVQWQDSVRAEESDMQRQIREKREAAEKANPTSKKTKEQKLEEFISDSLPIIAKDSTRSIHFKDALELINEENPDKKELAKAISRGKFSQATERMNKEIAQDTVKRSASRRTSTVPVRPK